MSELLLNIAAAWVLGLVGAGHCLGMCGGVVAALSFAAPAEHKAARWRLNLGYNIGRIASYALMGGMVAAVAGRLPNLGLPLARTLAGLLLIAMGLYLANWWRGLLWLERGGQWLWRILKPLADRWLPLDSFAKAVGVGMVWGWLPCGLVYAALGYALVQANAIKGALVMAAFGLGTLPALLVGGLLASRIKAALANHRVRRLLAAAYIGFGAWTMAAAWHHQIAHAGHGGHTTALEHSEGDGHSAREANHSSHPAEAQPDEGSVHQHHH